MTPIITRLNAARLASERAAVLELLPATKAQIVKTTGFSAWRVARGDCLARDVGTQWRYL
jgi:hypothetical protein